MDLKELNFNQLVKISVEQGQLPQFVYKYRPANDYTNKIFTESKLWFSKPCDFNDPFDCQVIVDTKNSEAEIARFLRLNVPHLPTKEVKRLSRTWSKNPIEWNRMVSSTIQSSINEKGVCCFASNINSILMWSHYTDSHKGICLKFDVLEDTDFFSVPFHVKYSKDYPHYNHIKDNAQLIKSLMQTKSDIWEYEGEVRVLKLFSGSYPFKKEALKEVCFGCSSTKVSIERIKNLASSNGFNISYSKAVKAKNQYGLEIKKL